MRALFLAASAALVVSVAAQAGAQQIVGARDARAVRADSVFRAFDRTDSPGCALGVFQDGQVRYARGYGMANLDLGVAIGPRTVFNVGSVSKQFTAMSILLLQQDGKLSIDDPVRKYIPEMPAYADRITLRQLLSHQSGIRDQYGLLTLAGRSFEGVADTVDYLRLITRSERPNFEPGTRYLYSNSGFALLATIVYRVSGKPLDQFARERIFEPLGMRDTRFHADHAEIIPNRATGYAPRAREGGREGNRESGREGAAGFRMQMSQFDGNDGPSDIHTSIEDFQKWDRNYDEATVGGRDVVRAIATASHFRNDSLVTTGPGQAYGLGVNVGTYRGLQVVSHGGSWAGYRAHFLRFPDQHVTVTTLCNLTTSGPDSLARKVADIYLGERMVADTARAWTVSLAAAPRAELSADALRADEGIWRNVELGEVRRTTVVHDTLFLGIGARTRLVPLGGGRFRGSAGTELSFEGDSAGRPTRLVVRTAGATTTFVRAAAVALTPAQLAEYAGEYTSPELEVTYTIRPDSGRLVVMQDGRRRNVLEPTYRDGFAAESMVVEFTRGSRGAIDGFVVEAGRVRHFRFVKKT